MRSNERAEEDQRGKRARVEGVKQEMQKGLNEQKREEQRVQGRNFLDSREKG